MRNRFWKGLRRTEWVIILLAMALFIGIVFSRYDNFKCRAMQSEAKFSLQQIHSAELLFHSEFDRYAPINKLLIEDKRLILPQNYYFFEDGVEPQADTFSILAKGKDGTLVASEIWSIDQDSNLKIVEGVCRKTDDE